MQQRCTGTHQYTWVENHAECCSLCSIYQVSTNPNACFCRLACPNMQLKFLLISGHMLSPSDVANRPVRSALPIDCHTCSGSSASQHQKPEQQFTGVSCHLQVGLCEFQIPRPWTLQSHSRWPHTYRAAARTFLLCAAHRRADAGESTPRQHALACGLSVQMLAFEAPASNYAKTNVSSYAMPPPGMQSGMNTAHHIFSRCAAH